MAEIEKLRKSIDEISLEILNLLNKRADIVKQIGIEKEKLGIEICNPLREETLSSILCKNNKGPFSNEAIKRIFKTIYDESKDLQIVKKDKITSLKIDLGNEIFIGKADISTMGNISEKDSDFMQRRACSGCFYYWKHMGYSGQCGKTQRCKNQDRNIYQIENHH